jgi:hypothetical protein
MARCRLLLSKPVRVPKKALGAKLTGTQWRKTASKVQGRIYSQTPKVRYGIIVRMAGAQLFLGYLKQVIKSWWFYVGVVMGVLRLVEKWTGIPVPIPHWIMLPSGIIGLCAAQWGAYKSLFVGRNKKIEALSILVKEGMGVRRSYPNTAIKYIDRSAEGAWMASWNDWLQKTRTFLSKEMAPQAVTKFMHDAGLDEGFTLGKSPVSDCSLFDRQIQNLIDMLDHPNAYL